MYQLVAGILLACAIAVTAFVAGESGAYSEGVFDGDQAGFERGVARTNELRDKELRAYIAEAREAAEKARADGFQKALEQERAKQDEIQQAARRHAENERKLAAANRALVSRVRRLEARDPAPSDNGGVPASGPAEPAGTDLAGLLHDSDRRMVDLAGQADAEAARYLACYRWVYGDGVRTE